MLVDEEKVEIFRQYRKRLFGIAYRMLGISADAEDILQEAYLRWHLANAEEIETPEAWLVTVTTRLAIDRLRKVSAERETYIGPWLPEPLMISNAPSPEDEMELASNLSIAFMILLERLGPVERAAFLLHDIFDCDYAEIGRIVGKSETASRQLIHRARERVRREKARFQTNEKEHTNLINKFTAASAAGDEQSLLALFSEEIFLMSDGGGKVHAARKIVYGKNRVAHLFAISGRKYDSRLQMQMVSVNGELGLAGFIDGELHAVTTFEVTDGKISGMYRVMNPDKLKDFSEGIVPSESRENAKIDD